MHLRSLQALALQVANSLFLGDYLTTEGQAAEADLEMVRDDGFTVLGAAAPGDRDRWSRTTPSTGAAAPAPPLPPMPKSPSGLLAFDREHVWHPYTSMTDPAPVRAGRARRPGVRLRLAPRRRHRARGRDVVLVGGHPRLPSPELDAAVRHQLGDSHVMFGGLTHAPAVRLAERLVELAPDAARHVFLADSGSVSVEVALKMALQYQRGLGRPERHRLLTVRGGYHGDTFGAMSVCDPVDGMHAALPRRAAASRSSPTGRRRAAATTAAWAADARATWSPRTRHELAGIIVEPVLQGAGGMHVYDAAVPAGAAPGGRRARAAADLRRDRHRVRPHRQALRRRAGRRDRRT